jgi:hypothetical protein
MMQRNVTSVGRTVYLNAVYCQQLHSVPSHAHVSGLKTHENEIGLSYNGRSKASAWEVLNDWNRI